MSSALFGGHPIPKNSGINPPFAPAYPLSWHADSFKRWDFVIEVDQDVVDEFLEQTPFRAASNRAVAMFAIQEGHTLSMPGPEGILVEPGGMVGQTESNVLVPIEYKGYVGWTFLFHYTNSEIAQIAGREIAGFGKKHGETEFVFGENSVAGTTKTWGAPLSAFEFEYDDDAPAQAEVVPGNEPPWGSFHVRRLPYPDRAEEAYADVVFRASQRKVREVRRGRGSVEFFDLANDPISRLGSTPRILSAEYIEAAFGGSLEGETRAIIEVLTTPIVQEGIIDTLGMPRSHTSALSRD